MNSCVLKVKKIKQDATIPTKAHENDAGFDLYALNTQGDNTDLPTPIRIINTGIAMEIPEGYFGLIKPRSGLSAKEGIDVLAGVVDSGYRGEIKVVLQSSNARGIRVIARGEKIAQIIILPLPQVKLEIVEELEESERGEKGFGSSDKKQ